MVAITSIIEKVCRQLGVDMHKIYSSTRTRPVPDARKMISFICMTKGISPTLIAAEMDKDRKAIYCQYRRHLELMDVDKEYRERFNNLKI